MSRTQFRNASGLPDAYQYSTARDMMVLGAALQAHFPQYFGYFSTRSLTYRGRRYASHNRLIGRVEGVNGIKTGYTRASGFNVVTSLQRDGRSLIAVVMGGRSAKSRDQEVESLISAVLPQMTLASTLRRP
jgi:D-alanyl-D-alanine carboxypeptidase